ERGFENLLFPLRIEGKEFRLFFYWPSTTTTVVATAAKNQPALRLPRERGNALVRYQVAVILDRVILRWIPNTHCAAQFAVGGFAPHINELAGAAYHRSRTQVSFADAAKGNRIAVRGGAEF